MKENFVTGHPAFGKRIGAFCVDYGILMLLGVLTMFFSPGLDKMGADFMSRFVITMVIAVGGLLFRDVFGRSLGKVLFGVYIVDADDPEKCVTIGQRILRNVPLLFWPVELIATRRDADYWRLGDRWAHTRVAADTRKKVPVMLFAALGGALLFGFFILFTVFHTMMNDGSYDTAVEYIETQDEIVSAVGGIERFGLPSGSIHTSNGYGSARLEIPVIGDDGRMTVNVILTKEPDEEWVVEEIDW